MKSKHRLLPLFIILSSANLCVQAADITWDTAATAGVQGGAGTWDTVTTNWTTNAGVTRLAWDNTANALDAAVFGVSGGAVNVAQAINLAGIKTVGNINSYVLSGSNLNIGSGLGSIDTSSLTTTGANVFTVNNALVGTGGLTIAASGNLSASGGSSGTRLDLLGNNTGLTGGIAITTGLVRFGSQASAGSNALTLSGGGGLVVTAGNLLLNNAISLSSGTSTLRGFGSTNLFLTGAISGANGFNKTDTGALFLTGANSFAGPVNVQGGSLFATSFNSVVGGSATSALGAPTTAANGTITLGGSGQVTLGYLGTGETTDRVLHFSTGSGGIVTGHGNLNLSSNMTGAANAFGLVVNGGGNSSMNGISTGALINFNKQGLGIWTVNGNLNLVGGEIRPQGGIVSFSATSSTTANAPIAGRSNQGVIRFATGSSVLTATANTNGILGGWATFDNSTWAKTNGSGNAIDGFTAFTDDTWAAGTNTNVTLAGGNPSADSTTNSVRFNEAGAKTLTLAGINTLTSGGILVTGNVGANTTTIAGGTLTTTGANNDLILNQFNSAANLTVSTVLSNNVRAARTGTTTSGSNSITGLTSTADLAVGMLITGTGMPANATITAINSATQITISGNATATGTPSLSPVGVTLVTKTGTGTVVLSGANNYTGTTRVFEGTLRVTGNNGNKYYEVGSQGRLELDIDGGTSGYGRGILVNGGGVDSTNGAYLAGGRNFNFQSTLRLAGAPTTVRQFGTGAAILHGWDTNGTHLAVENTASGSVIGTNVNFQSGGFGYVMNIAPGLNTATGDVIINGILSGSTVYRKTGFGSVRLDGSGSSNNTGSFDLQQGSLILAGSNNRLGSGSNVILGNGANSSLLVLEGVNQTLTALTTAGTGTDNRVVGGSATLSRLTINNSSASTLAATLGGSGANENNLALTKSGAGTLILSGTNTHTGGTTLTGGLLELASAGALGSTGTISMNGGGLRFTTANTTDYSGRIRLEDATTSTFDTNGENLTFATAFSLGTLGTGGFTKTGAGTLTVNSGSWRGTTTVSGGTLEVASKTNDVAYVVNQGATLRVGYTTGGSYANTNLKLNGDGVSATTGLYLKGGTTYNGSGTIELLTAPTTIRQYGTGLAGIGMFDINGNAISVSAAASGSVIDGNIEMISRGFGMSVSVASGTNTASGDLVINGRLNAGNLGFYKRGAGSLVLNAAATTSNAAVRIQGGRVIAGVANALGENAELPISAGASLVMNGFSQAAGSLSGAGTVVNGSASAAVLTIKQTSDQTFSGVLGGTGTDENNFGLVKTGASTLTLSGTNTYTGSTTVNQGKLNLTGSASLASNSTTVAIGATLSGTGTITGNTEVYGSLLPGNSPGTLNFTNDLSLAASTLLGFELSALDMTAGGGINDLVAVGGDFILDGTLRVTALDSFTGTTSGSWTLFTYDGALTDNGLILDLVNMPVLDSGFDWQLSYGPGVVSLNIIPEPSGWLLGAAGACLWLARRRRVVVA
jgi:autotransporter-associated beta strand protein